MFNFFENLKNDLIDEIREGVMEEIRKELNLKSEKRCFYDVENDEKETDIVFIIDESGSMQDIKSETIRSYNNFLKEEFKKEGKTYVTTVLFNDRYKVMNKRVDINEVSSLTGDNYVPGGCTALMDAIGKTVVDMENKVKRNNKVIMVIITDGEENASNEYNKKQVRNMIKRHENWEFVFLGADIDSFSEARELGIRDEYVANFKKEGRSVGNLFKCVKKLYDDECFDLQKEIDS